MATVEHQSNQELTRRLSYAGLILVGFELVKSMIVRPIKSFYASSTFGPGMPFTSYEVDVRSRHPIEFEACLLYLQDFMQAINSDDVSVIQDLRSYRNVLAHELPNRLSDLEVDSRRWERVGRVLFKLSNYRTRMEIGADPALDNANIVWETMQGGEYLLFEQIVSRIEAVVGTFGVPSVEHVDLGPRGSDA